EAERRRRRRGGRDARLGRDRSAERDRLARRGGLSARLRGYYANLELTPGASLDDARAAYGRLREKYHPRHHAGDEDKAATAQTLLDGLAEAYSAVRDHLRRSSR
ncbi:MAG: DnaJ domain-containing protein, partial [Myxococcota bacterium]